MEWSNIGLAFAAGLLSTLSPCVLPMLSLVFGTALSKHRLGPVILALGLSISFVTIGLFVAMIGFAIGLDEGVFRAIAGVFLLAIGLVLVVPQLELQLAVAAGPSSNWVQQRFGGNGDGERLASQFGLGILLGGVWSPCVGPTLGAASLMAAQGQNLGQVALTMLLFGIGATIPLLLISLGSRSTLLRWRDRIMAGGNGGKRIFGAVLIFFALLTLSGMDRALQAALIRLSPEWLTSLSISY